MKLFIKILFFVLTWLTTFANGKSPSQKNTITNFSVSFSKTEIQKLESEVKIGVQNFARSGISENLFSKKENAGKAVPLTLLNDYNQYVNKYDTECAFFLGMEYMAMYAETIFEPIVVANAIGKIQKLAKTFKGPKGSIDDLLKKNSAGVQGAGNWITQRTSFWDDWINKCFPSKNWSNTTFQTVGKDYNAFKSANTTLDNEMRAMYNSVSDADNFLPGIVNSGSTNPIKVTANQGDKFYKIVPKGNNINSPSPYYLSEAEFQWIKANPSQLEQKLGLPLSSVNAEYDVFTITSKINNNTLFQSTVAPTKQFANATPNVIYNTTGGRIQSLIINNGKANLQEKSTAPIETISPNSLPLIGN